MKDLRDKVAAITGAASGIGEALALALAAEGTHLALADIDAPGLAAVAERCLAHDIVVTTSEIDVSDRTAVFGWADDVVARHGRANLVVNNAGVAMASPADTQSIADFEWLMGINFWGVVHGTQAFLPHLRAAGDGHVVNISSVFGLVSIPSQSAYNAAKFAVRGFTDALRMELELEGAPISVTTVHPGGIKTAIARNARAEHAHEFQANFDNLARTSSEKAADQIVRAIRRDRRRTLIGPDAPLFDLTARLPASISERIVMSVSRRQAGSALPRTSNRAPGQPDQR